MDSSTVFGLRKEAKELQGEAKLSKLNEGLVLAKQLYQTEPFDEWVQKALANTLIDLCKFYINKNQIEFAISYYNNLVQINFTEFDEIIENQKKYLRPKLDPHFSHIKRADELSKTGSHIQALNIFKDFINKNQLSELHHESYGWVIYRYLAKSEVELTSIQVRTYLRDYMLLKNERPSMLHSMILNFGLNYSKDHGDFNLYKFFKLWNPSNLRDEDKDKQYYNEKEIPSLVSKVCRVLIEMDYEIDVAFLIEKIKFNSWHGESSSTQKTLDILREPFFWKIMNAKKESNLNTVWKLFSNYLIVFSPYVQSHWHSEILNIAERFMVEKDEPKFLEFFRKWNPENLLEADWEEQIVGENSYPPLAKKCIKKAFTIIKTREKKIWIG